MNKDDGGDYVLYSDHEAAIAERCQCRFDDAKQEITTWCAHHAALRDNAEAALADAQEELAWSMNRTHDLGRMWTASEKYAKHCVIAIKGLEDSLAEKDKRIEVLLRTNKTHLDTMLVQTKRIAELEAENERLKENLPKSALDLERENVRLREAGENLRDYLNKGTWRDFDIPDEIWGPFEKSLDGPDWIAQAALRGEGEG